MSTEAEPTTPVPPTVADDEAPPADKKETKKRKSKKKPTLESLAAKHATQTLKLRQRQAKELKALRNRQGKELRASQKVVGQEEKAKAIEHKGPSLKDKERFYKRPHRELKDPNSVTLLNQKVTHYHLDLTADFKRSVLAGSIDLTFQFSKSRQEAAKIQLDVKSLKIHTVSFKDGAALPFQVRKAGVCGSKLIITLPEPQAAGTSVVVRVEYETTPDSSAIQWLPPSQTLGKEQPYLFTQCQAIHARSVMPCQDSPAVKSTYTARIVVQDPLIALMSAQSTKSEPAGDGQKAFFFEQKVPIPSYLLALAIGLLEKRDISERCAVWGEAGAVDKARHEFEDTERFLSVAEEICGPYVWGRYDVLVMPPSFPYGGMENPCLTFVTPTLLAGDKSLANVVAHEISHSWMGNLVGCETWEHFWMNEGFTVYLERKICKALHGSAAMHLDAIGGWNALVGSVNHFGCSHAFTELHVNVKGVDPDDAFSSIPYEKGFNFLFFLESLLGEEKMNAMLKAHCEQYKFSTVNCFKWKKWFLERFKDEDPALLAQIDWNQWLHAPGLPPKPNFDTSMVDASHQLAIALVGGQEPAADVDFKSWSSPRVVAFLEKLLNLQAASQDDFQPILADIENRYQLLASGNSEIRFRWLTLNVRAQVAAVFPNAVAFLLEQGRMKFIRPLYRDLFKSNEEGKALAVDTFQTNRAIYHNIASSLVAKDLGLA